ncbi:MAG: T9SS type A sorting domain-containing protein [Ignavibacteriae bacterium]|nr:T9SS type A sorting domain-containing protein [Ignavibacteriota bacterium]
MGHRTKLIFILILISFITSLEIYPQLKVNPKSVISSSGFLNHNISKKVANPSSAIFQDDMNGDNSISGLEARGWIILNEDGGGEHPTWFQGNLYETNFSAFDGLANDYVASDWEGGNSSSLLDHWLISPKITVSDNDTISFWIQSPVTSFEDSISVHLSLDGGANISDFSLAYDDGSLTQRYLVPQGNWVNWRGILPEGNIRFAIRHHSADTDSYAWYLGVDLVEVLSSSIIIAISPFVTTDVVSDVTETSVTLNGSINPNGATTTYIFEYGTTTSYGNITSNAEELTGTSDINVTANINDLTSNTLYHYRITATNSAGTTNSSDATFTTTNSTSGADLLWQTLIVSSFNWQVGNTITAELNILNNGLATAESHQSQLYLSVDKTINTQDIPLGNPISYLALSAGGSLTLSETFNVPAISNGIYYIGAIVDINNNVSESNESNNNFYRTGKIVIGQPESITLSNTVSFGISSQSSSYRMLGIPGDNNIPISQSLIGSNGDDWVAYYDNGNSSDYLIEYDGTSVFNFKPGNGFWVLANSNLIISQSATSVELQSELMPNSSYEIVYPILLHNGWNIISNPFETSVSWEDIKTINSVSENIHSFNGSFSAASSFQPYNGYYFYNASNITSLYIPYSVNENIPKMLSKTNDKTEEIILSLLHDNIPKSIIAIGFNDDAKITYDNYDRFAPPGDFDEFRLSIFNENLDTPYKYLLTDFRPSSNEGEIYAVKLKAKLNEKIKIQFSIPVNYQDSEVFLVNQNSNLINMKISKSIEFIPTRHLYELKILIGNQEFINNQREKILPKEFSLDQNFPNPFNPTTNIRFTIPKTKFVTLDIYNAIGQKVTSLVNKKLNPGIYTEQWNAINYSSGIYYAKLSAGNNVVTQKLVLMK